MFIKGRVAEIVHIVASGCNRKCLGLTVFVETGEYVDLLSSDGKKLNGTVEMYLCLAFQEFHPMITEMKRGVGGGGGALYYSPTKEHILLCVSGGVILWLVLPFLLPVLLLLHLIQHLSPRSDFQSHKKN